MDWPGLMRAGIGGLRLLPRDFWSLTPAELRVMLGVGAAVVPPLSRARLAELAAAFPDGESGDGAGRSGGTGGAAGRGSAGDGGL
ncbi:MAG: phage tail assembly chaperone [Rhodobacteraceae bacterium]|nr:phage tail assembly chaperone [Paracoccaceae bacterium]